MFLARLLTDLRLEDKRFFINAKLEREKRQRLISLPHFSGRLEAKEGMFRGERVLRRAFLLGEKAQEALVLTLSEIFCLVRVRIQGGLNNFFFTVFKHIIRSVIELRFLADSALQISALSYLINAKLFVQSEVVEEIGSGYVPFGCRGWLSKSIR